MSTLQWKKTPGRYAYGDDLYLGRWKVGSAGYDGTQSKGSPEKYFAQSRLPGLKAHLGNFDTLEGAKTKVEYATQMWIEGAKL